jgi:iron(III) transport system substrate-binding protein
MVAGAMVFAGCGGPSVPEGPPLLVLATGEPGGELSGRIAEFTDETGIPVSVEWGTSSDNATRLIEKSGSPVDVLLTDNVADIWRAAEQGALRPIQSPAFAQVAAHWKDPDKMWAAIDVRPYIVIYPPGEAPGGTYQSLADPALKGGLCLTSSELAQSRVLIANLIDDLGMRPAERVVRGWVKNLGVAPFPSQEDLLDALRDGRCQYGIASLTSNPEGLLSFVPPNAEYYDIGAIGVGRHAQQPERAQQFVNWMLEFKTWQAGTGISARNVGVAGWRADEARLLAERAGYW